MITKEKEYTSCQRCGRALKNPKYRELGFGPSCHKKYLAESKKGSHRLFEVKSNAAN